MRSAILNKTFFPFVLITIILLVQGCSELKPYPPQKYKNLTISTDISSDSLFSSVNAEVDIFSINKSCNKEYKGALYLDNASISTGLESNTMHYLSFIFSSSSFLWNNNSSTNYPFFIKPKNGYTYDFVVSYKDSIYNVELFEVNNKGKRREIDESSNPCTKG